jgi:hypothetical protein
MTRSRESTSPRASIDCSADGLLAMDAVGFGETSFRWAESGKFLNVREVA